MTERDLFLSALQRSPEERDEYLDRACGTDVTLRQRLSALLQIHDRPRVALDRMESTTPLEPLVDSTPVDEPIGTVIASRYTILGVIGRGGMGTVYLARQTEPVERQVAVKVIRGRASPAALTRFAAERQTLALMSHPGIARVYDGGTTPGGQPFFVMELVDGEPLTMFCDSRQMSIPGRLNLFIGLCEAVQHAHQKGIVHRDLKPTNILAAEGDQGPRVTVIDFGVAVASSNPDRLIAGTRDYMAPEQAAAVPDIDTRADIYALGVILFELLTGGMPAGEGASPSEALKSTIDLAPIAEKRALQPARLSRLLRGDLDWIVQRSLAPDREQRYQTVAALAKDLRLFLAGRPLAERPIGIGTRFAKFCRRNPVLTGLTAAVAVLGMALAIGAVVVNRQLAQEATEQARLQEAADAERQRARDEEARAREETARATAITEMLKEMYAPRDQIFIGSVCLGFWDAKGHPNEDDALRLGVARLSASDGFRDRPLVRAELLHSLGMAYFGLSRPRDAAPLFEEALELRRKHLPPGDPALASSLLAVAQVRTFLTDDVAQELFQEAIDLWRKNPASDPDGSHLAEAETSYAILLMHYWGEKAETHAILNRVYQVHKKVLGDDHPQTLTTLIILVSLEVDSGNYFAVSQKLGSLLAGLEKCKSRPELRECGKAWVNMLAVMALQGEQKAIEPGRRAVEVFARVMGPKHFMTVRVRYMLAWLYMHQYKTDEALTLLQECLTAVESWGAVNSFARAQIHLHMGRMLRGSGRSKDAIPHLRTSLELFRKLARRPAEHRLDYPWALEEYARNLIYTNGPAEEIGRAYEEAAAYCRERPKVEEYRRGYAFLYAAKWFLRRGNAAAALPHCRDAVASWEREKKPYGRHYVTLCLAMESMALRQTGQVKEADAAAQRCQELLAKLTVKNPESTEAGLILQGQLPSPMP